LSLIEILVLFSRRVQKEETREKEESLRPQRLEKEKKGGGGIREGRGRGGEEKGLEFGAVLILIVNLSIRWIRGDWGGGRGGGDIERGGKGGKEGRRRSWELLFIFL